MLSWVELHGAVEGEGLQVGHHRWVVSTWRAGSRCSFSSASPLLHWPLNRAQTQGTHDDDCLSFPLLRASDKLFLLDQCEKYRRCKQCQRRTSNVGESNLWPLNKYLHGSRLFV